MRIRLHKMKPRTGWGRDCEWLGSVAIGPHHGALMRLQDRYYLVHRGEAMPLDAQAVAVAMAEALARPLGRPVGPDGKLERSTVLLSNAEVEMARKIGKGNISLGLRIAVGAYVIPTDGSN